mmetsp:Transcript_11105/g.14497  ORF Transcript_11105/g.14497 Transcript_11105/m.14497 type:complete len:245 (-) Transcript_11105:769-1503(-)
MAIVERFNRTLKEMTEDKVLAKEGGPDKYKRSAYLNDVLEEYNFEKDHKSLKKFMRRDLKKHSKKHTREDSDGEEEEVESYTPADFVAFENTKEYVKSKEKETEEVDKYYKTKIEKLKEKPNNVRIWKKKHEKNYYKKVDDYLRLSALKQVVAQHEYQKPNAKIDEEGNAEKTEGKSFKMKDDQMRYLPYDIWIPGENKYPELLKEKKRREKRISKILANKEKKAKRKEAKKKKLNPEEALYLD